MTDVAIDNTALSRWRADPVSFVEDVLHDPETGKPFVLLEAERAFMRHAFAFGPDDRLAYPELVYGAPKKSGKSTCAAIIVLVMVLLRRDGKFSEGYCCANDFEQAQSRTFTIIRRIVEASPLLRSEAKISDGMLFAWHHQPVAPWQDERWLEEMRRSLRPSAYARMICNEFVSAESRFVDLEAWDSCVRLAVVSGRGAEPADGVDASTKRDSTALVAVTFQHEHVRLVAHKVFTPTPGNPINFETTIERTLREWHQRFLLRQVLFDPYQMAAVSQRLAGEGIPIEECAMTPANLAKRMMMGYEVLARRVEARRPKHE
jgi:phage terminase large subunit-like protein